jgi:hypothetical protein
MDNHAHLFLTSFADKWAQFDPDATRFIKFVCNPTNNNDIATT